MKNWKEYIDEKFQPAEEFEVLQDRHEDALITITYNHISTENSVCFFWPNKDWSIVKDIQYYNRRP